MLYLGLQEIGLSVAVGIVAGVVCASSPRLRRTRGGETFVFAIFTTATLAAGASFVLWKYHATPNSWGEHPPLDDDIALGLALTSAIISAIGLPAALLVKIGLTRLIDSRLAEQNETTE